MRARSKGPTKKGKSNPKWNKRYGLEDSDSVEAEAVTVPLSDLFEEDVYGTAKSLSSLRQHADYKKWVKQRKLTAKEILGVDRRLQLYQELREADPHAFRKLLSGHEPEDNLTLPCPALLLVLEYLLNTVLTAVLLVLLAAASSQVARYMLAGCLLWNVLLWLQGTSIFGTWARLWWEDTQWRHQAAWRSCLAANLVEVVYCASSLGLGGLVSLALRLQGEGGQGVGERLLHIRLVREVRQPVEFAEAPGPQLRKS